MYYYTDCSSWWVEVISRFSLTFKDTCYFQWCLHKIPHPQNSYLGLLYYPPHQLLLQLIFVTATLSVILQ